MTYKFYQRGNQIYAPGSKRCIVVPKTATYIDISDFCGERCDYIFIPKELQSEETESFLNPCIYEGDRKFGEIYFY